MVRAPGLSAQSGVLRLFGSIHRSAYLWDSTIQQASHFSFPLPRFLLARSHHSDMSLAHRLTTPMPGKSEPLYLPDVLMPTPRLDEVIPPPSFVCKRLYMRDGGDGSSLQEQMYMQNCGDVFSQMLVCRLNFPYICASECLIDPSGIHTKRMRRPRNQPQPRVR